jgi:hypothetical protein
LKHCFPKKAIKTGEGYTKIQSQLWHSNVSVKSILYQLATTYSVIDPTITSPSAPSDDAVPARDDELDEIEQDLSLRDSSETQGEATQYALSKVGKGTKGKFKKFCNDDRLDKIRRNQRTLNHIPKLMSSYKDEETTAPTSAKSITQKLPEQRATRSSKKKGIKRKTRSMSAQSGDVVAVDVSGGAKKKSATDADESSSEPTKKKKRSLPRCVLCTELSTGEEYKSIPQTATYCPTCTVHLCPRVIGKSKFSCYEKWHRVKDLKQLLRCKGVTPKTSKPLRTSPRKQNAPSTSPLKKKPSS